MQKSILSAALIVLSSIMFPHNAMALNLKSFISHSGADANSCADVANFCATINGALNKTAAGGEITIVDTGDYDTTGITINSAITISNDGAGEASIRNPSGGNGMFIHAGNGDAIILRGMTFEGNYTGNAGIIFQTGAALQIEDCVFRNWQGSGGGFGLFFQPFANSQLFVTNSTFFNNGTSGNSGGIGVQPGGSANVVLDHVHVDFNVQGIFLDTGQDAASANGISAVLRDSVVSKNAGNGVSVSTASGKPPARVFVERSSIIGNTVNGVVANGPHAIAALTSSTITRNGTGVSAVSGGQIISYGDNKNNFNLGAEGVATSSLSAF